MISVKRSHAWTSRAKILSRTLRLKYPCRARYLVDNCHVFQSGLIWIHKYTIAIPLKFLLWRRKVASSRKIVVSHTNKQLNGLLKPLLFASVLSSERIGFKDDVIGRIIYFYTTTHHFSKWFSYVRKSLA